MLEENLSGKDLTGLYRAGDMLCLQIGDTILIESDRGGMEESPEYRIHFQCQWRFVKKGSILLASHDIYNPYDNELEWDEDWSWDIFGREKEQSSVFDVRSEEFAHTLLPLKTEHFHFTDTGDLHIHFNKDVFFETFITCSTKREYYRILNFHTDEHTVFFDVD